MTKTIVCKKNKIGREKIIIIEPALLACNNSFAF